MFFFIGITTNFADERVLNREFEGTPVSYRKINGKNCLYYKDRILEANQINFRNACKVQLQEFEMQQLVNTLKKVRSEELYDSYPDNFGLQRIGLLKKITVKKK